MTHDEVRQLLEQYSAGVDAEVNLLRQLADVAERQRDVAHSADFTRFNQIADTRDALMRSLVTLEDGLGVIRHQLAEYKEVAAAIVGYEEVAARHRDAAMLVNAILATDRQSIAALADAELARRSAVASIERGESTLAAYRRVLSPPVDTARLVDKHG